MLSMVEIRPEKINQLEQDARMYIRRNEEKFQKAAEVLLQKRKLQQKIMDWVTLQRKVSGLWIILSHNLFKHFITCKDMYMLRKY